MEMGIYSYSVLKPPSNVDFENLDEHCFFFVAEYVSFLEHLF